MKLKVVLLVLINCYIETKKKLRIPYKIWMWNIYPNTILNYQKEQSEKNSTIIFSFNQTLTNVENVCREFACFGISNEEIKDPCKEAWKEACYNTLVLLG